MGHNRPGSDHCEAPDAYPWEDHRAAADCGSVMDDSFAHPPVAVRFKRTIRVDRSRVLVVEEHHAGAKKHAVLEVEAVKHEDTVLELAPVADPDIDIDVRVFSQDAFAADGGALADLDAMDLDAAVALQADLDVRALPPLRLRLL